MEYSIWDLGNEFLFYFNEFNFIQPHVSGAILLNNAGIGIKTNNAENEKLSNNNIRYFNL